MCIIIQSVLRKKNCQSKLLFCMYSVRLPHQHAQHFEPTCVNFVHTHAHTYMHMDMNSKVTNSVRMLIIPTFLQFSHIHVRMCMQHKIYMYCSSMLFMHSYMYNFTFPLHTHTHARTHTHAGTHMQAHTRKHTHAHAHTHTHRYTSKAFRYVDVPVYELFILVHTCTGQNMLCTHTIHTYMYIHACTHIRGLLQV